jgi:hypothetical protein
MNFKLHTPTNALRVPTKMASALGQLLSGSNVLLVEWAFHLAEANSCGARSGIIRAELMLLGGR